MRLTVRMKDPRYDVRDRYAASCNIPFSNDYTGNILPNLPWMSDNQFLMATGNPDAPYRILDKDRIICGWTAPTVSGQSDPEYVLIPGKSGRKYTVSICDGGNLICNCTGFGYRRTCSHVKEVEAA